MIENLKDTFTHISENYSETITKTTFNNTYGFRNIPVVFRHAFQNWEVRELFSIENLLKTFPSNYTFPVESRGNDKVKFSLKTYLDHVTKTRSTPYYFVVQLQQFKKLFSYQTPMLFNCWYRSKAEGIPKTDLSWLYVGGDGTQTKLHLDIWNTNAWNYLISGIKIWFFYPENVASLVLNQPAAYEFDSYLENPELFLTNKVRPLICIQRPGDLVFSPGNCLHSVYNVGLTTSITENFINETCYDRVLQFFKKGKNIKSINSLNAIVASGFSELNSVYI